MALGRPSADSRDYHLGRSPPADVEPHVRRKLASWVASVSRTALNPAIAERCPVAHPSVAERAVLFRAVCERDLEGIVAKLAKGLYAPDEPSWVKVKNRAYSQNAGPRELLERRRGTGAYAGQAAAPTRDLQPK